MKLSCLLLSSLSTQSLCGNSESANDLQKVTTLDLLDQYFLRIIPLLDTVEEIQKESFTGLDSESSSELSLFNQINERKIRLAPTAAEKVKNSLSDWCDSLSSHKFSPCQSFTYQALLSDLDQSLVAFPLLSSLPSLYLESLLSTLQLTPPSDPYTLFDVCNGIEKALTYASALDYPSSDAQKLLLSKCQIHLSTTLPSSPLPSSPLLSSSLLSSSLLSAPYTPERALLVNSFLALRDNAAQMMKLVLSSLASNTLNLLALGDVIALKLQPLSVTFSSSFLRKEKNRMEKQERENELERERRNLMSLDEVTFHRHLLEAIRAIKSFQEALVQPEEAPANRYQTLIERMLSSLNDSLEKKNVEMEEPVLVLRRLLRSPRFGQGSGEEGEIKVEDGEEGDIKAGNKDKRGIKGENGKMEEESGREEDTSYLDTSLSSQQLSHLDIPSFYDGEEEGNSNQRTLWQLLLNNRGSHKEGKDQRNSISNNIALDQTRQGFRRPETANPRKSSNNDSSLLSIYPRPIISSPSYPPNSYLTSPIDIPPLRLPSSPLAQSRLQTPNSNTLSFKATGQISPFLKSLLESPTTCYSNAQKALEKNEEELKKMRNDYKHLTGKDLPSDFFSVHIENPFDTVSDSLPTFVSSLFPTKPHLSKPSIPPLSTNPLSPTVSPPIRTVDNSLTPLTLSDASWTSALQKINGLSQDFSNLQAVVAKVCSEESQGPEKTKEASDKVVNKPKRRKQDKGAKKKGPELPKKNRRVRKDPLTPKELQERQKFYNDKNKAKWQAERDEKREQAAQLEEARWKSGNISAVEKTIRETAEKEFQLRQKRIALGTFRKRIKPNKNETDPQ